MTRPKVTNANYARWWDDSISNARRSWPIDEPLVKGLERYVKERIPTGDFLRAVLENDLTSAVAHADSENLHHIRYIVMFVRAIVPYAACGNREKVLRWLTGVEEDE